VVHVLPEEKLHNFLVMKLTNLIPDTTKIDNLFTDIEILDNNQLNSIKGGKKVPCEEGCKSGSKNAICISCATGGKKA
jgi:hypothetical protein